MIEILENFELTNYNTFGVEAKARFFCRARSYEELKDLLSRPEFTRNEKLFLGHGSNVLFTHDFPGIVILNEMKGKEIINEYEESVELRVASGEDWHDFVCYAGVMGWWGIENLALIPGTVGGAPVQNIGAYGSEAKDTIVSVEALDITTGKQRVFENAECNFGYRDSIFKGELKGKYFISAVVFKLSKKPKMNLSYKALADYLAENKIEINSPEDVISVVSAIRKSKLPDPKILGNAGSFFKNVYVGEDKLAELQKMYPTMPFFLEEGKIKIPTAWLIETLDWKGKRQGNVGVHDKQALVLVNYGGARGEEVHALAQSIISSVKDKFGLTITPEVNIL